MGDSLCLAVTARLSNSIYNVNIEMVLILFCNSMLIVDRVISPVTLFFCSNLISHVPTGACWIPVIFLDSHQLLSNMEKYSCSFTSFKLLLLNLNKTIDGLFLWAELSAFKASVSDYLKHNGEGSKITGQIIHLKNICLLLFNPDAISLFFFL